MLHRLKGAGRSEDADGRVRGLPGKRESVTGAGKRVLEGRTEGVKNDAIIGWVWDANQPYEPVEVELYCGDLLVGRGMADKFDIDLARANRGNGLHRFELQLDRLPPKQPPFTVRAIVVNTDVELGPPLTIQTLGEAERLLSGNEYVGEVMGVVDGAVCGWVFNRRNPHESPVLTLRDGDREIGTQVANAQINKVLDSGAAVLAFRFELPLPLSVLDGRLHNISVLVGASGGRALGSPILFGTSDTSSLGQTLVAISDRIERLERRFEALQPALDIAQTEKRVAARIVEPVDMLLNVHRDAMEREMAVIRRQITEILRHVPQMDPDMIAPQAARPAIEDVAIAPATTFDPIDRSAPLVKYDLSTQVSAVKPAGDVRWVRSGTGASIALNGSGTISLEGAPNTQAGLVINGAGAGDGTELSALVLSFNGRPLSGRFDVFSDGEWTFVGSTIEMANAAPSAKPTLEIVYLRDLMRASGKLRFNAIAVFAPGRAPLHVDGRQPEATVLNLGRESCGNGWHPVEAGPRGGICWMGEMSDVSFNLRPAGSCRITIPEFRPLVPDLASKLQVFLDGEPVDIRISPMSRDSAGYSLQGRCAVQNGSQSTRTLRIGFPEDAVKSPMELGLNPDLRPLSIAVRCIVIAADGS